LHEATRNITQQLDFKPLLSTILQAVMERLGAKTAFLLVANHQELEVVARGDKLDTVQVINSGDHNLSCDSLSMAIVNYVYRTAEMLVIENACEQGDFITDATVQKQKLKSVLCIPLVLKQTVMGILYLENKLIPAVFTPEQQELVKLLTAQAAVALQNTQLVKRMQKNQQEIETLNKELEHRVAQRTAELNRVNEELNNFAYVVSHDLKAPLRAINQLTGWIAEDYAEVFNDEGRQQIQLIQSRARRMHEMIDGILQYSRIGRVKEDFEQIHLENLIKDAIRMIAPAEHVKIYLKGLFPEVKAEKIRLQQVFQNLLDNAIKYNDKPECEITISCEPKDFGLEISVADNGPGIAQKYQQKIFQLFQTLHTKDESDSTGIGLSLIEKAVTHWGGKIWVESKEGQGCKFIFTLPVSGCNDSN
jgi:signal transduction histidine kinase